MLQEEEEERERRTYLVMHFTIVVEAEKVSDEAMCTETFAVRVAGRAAV